MTRNMGESPASVTPLVGGDLGSSARPGEVGLSATSGALSPGLLPHPGDHDPTLDHERCETCNALLRRAFVRLADRVMGPRDADELMAAIRAELAEVA